MVLGYTSTLQINNNLRLLPKKKDASRTELDASVSWHFPVAVHHVYEDSINSHDRKRAVRIK